MFRLVSRASCYLGAFLLPLLLVEPTIGAERKSQILTKKPSPVVPKVKVPIFPKKQISKPKAMPTGSKRFVVDSQHTNLQFSVDYLLVTKVTGTFQKFTGEVWYDPKKHLITFAEAIIDTASIDSEVKKRDKHLRSADFFHVEQYPKMYFRANKFKHKGSYKDKNGILNHRGSLLGKLSIKDKTRAFSFEVRDLKVIVAYETLHLAFTARGVIRNRSDYSINFSDTFDNGLVVGKKVDLDIQFTGQASEPTL